MANDNELIQRLMVSKKIMDKHREIPRGQNTMGNVTMSEGVEDFEVPQAKYDIPQEFITESRPVVQNPTMVNTKDKILSSKLPDDIKRLMIEHPINQPNNMSGPSLSNDLVEKASRLMNVNAAGKPIGKSKQTQQQFSGLDADTIKSIVRETVEEVLSENGLLTESTSKSNEVFSFKVGNHRFEGKVTKIVKVK